MLRAAFILVVALVLDGVMTAAALHISASSFHASAVVDISRRGDPHPQEPVAKRIERERLFEMLDQQYQAGDGRAVQLATALADAEDQSLRDAFVYWLHNRAARDFVPVPRHSAMFDKKVLFVDRVIASGGPFARDVSSGLRLWIHAALANGESDYRAAVEYTDGSPAAYGPRYQLLAFDLIEFRSPNPSLVEASRSARDRLLGATGTLAKNLSPAGPYDPGHERARLRYWTAFGRYQQVAIGQKLNKFFWHELEEATLFSLDYTHDERQPAWSEEQAALGGLSEYITPHAMLVEKLGGVDPALGLWTDASRVNPSALNNLRRLFMAVHPNDNFDDYWRSERFRYMPALPAGLADQLKTAGRWSAFKIWPTDCAQCLNELDDLERSASSLRTMMTIGLIGDEGASLKARLAEAGWAKQTVTLTSGANPVSEHPPATIVIRPDGKYIHVVESQWSAEVRYWLRVP
jgi:hypothetical protein